jgi:UDP:flavonoid glycosyltransferase YjiC (YdhE family)
VSRRVGARILFAWELGANLGHIVAMLGVARRLRERGHRVVFALRDLSNAVLLAREGFAFFPAPPPPRAARPASYASYAAMLAGEAFPSLNATLAGALAWRSILTATRADLLIADHAPLALLAARGRKLRVAAFGVPFTVPTLHRPLPRFRASDGDARKEEDVLLRRLNKAAAALRAPPLERLADLYRVDATMVRAVPETDCFAPRPQADYVVPQPADAGEAVPAWPTANGQKVLVYLRAGPWIGPVCDALAEQEATAIAQIANIDADAAAALGRPGLTVTRELCKFSELIRQSDAVICHANHNTVVGALLAGKPLVMMPNQVEQALTAARVAAIGAGGVPSGAPSAAAVARCLDTLRPGSPARKAAQAIARRHRDSVAADPVKRAEALL